MTKIRFLYNDKNIVGFVCKGHAGYAQEGQDIVCSSISSLTGACFLGLKKILKLDLETEIDEKSGYFFLELKNGAEKNEKAQLLLKTLMMSLEDVSKGYEKFIKIEK